MNRCMLLALGLSACVVETAIVDPPSPPLTSVVPPPVDGDGDGFTAVDGDCDDSDDRVGPATAFTESCDGRDNDCNGEVDDLGVCLSHDAFAQSMALDVLFVVDTTEGMEPYLRQAGQAASSFLVHLVGPGQDTRVGVVTMAVDKADDTTAETATTAGFELPYTGEKNGELVRVGGDIFLAASESSDDVNERWLRRAIADHEPHPGPPRARDAVLAHLGELPTTDVGQATFLRPGVPLVTVFLSREEDQSEVGVAAFRESLLDSFDVAPVVHAIVRLGDQPCAGDTVGAFGASYATLADQTNGVTLDVCSGDYTSFFFVTGQLAADLGLGRSFPLDEVVDTSRPLLVQVVAPTGFVTVLEATDYEIVDGGTTLLLDEPPTAGSEVLVDYHRVPDPT